jgi:hypothetical protein
MDTPTRARITLAERETDMASTMSNKLTRSAAPEAVILEEIPFTTASPAVSLEADLKPNSRFGAKLVKILERKGILSHSEAAELLHDLK